MGLLDARKTPTDGELYGEMAGEYRIVRKLGTGDSEGATRELQDRVAQIGRAHV